MNHEMKLFIKFIMKKDAIVYMTGYDSLEDITIQNGILQIPLLIYFNCLFIPVQIKNVDKKHLFPH